MNTMNKNGCSVVIPGSERHAVFSWRDQKHFQYDFRTLDGNLFSCVGKSLSECRQKRDKWLKENGY